MTHITPRAWVGSLAAYNQGDLLGDWFDWDEIPEDASEWVDAMITRGLIPKGDGHYLDAMAARHEEIWVFDHEGYEPFKVGEEGSPREFRELGELLDDDTLDRDVLRAVGEAFGTHYFDAEGTIYAARELYDGTYRSVAEYAADRFIEVTDLPENLTYYIDGDAYWEELRNEGYSSAELSWQHVYIFKPDA